MMPLRPSRAPITANTFFGTLVCSAVMELPYRCIGRMYAKLNGMSARDGERVKISANFMREAMSRSEGYT